MLIHSHDLLSSIVARQERADPLRHHFGRRAENDFPGRSGNGRRFKVHFYRIRSAVPGELHEFRSGTDLSRRTDHRKEIRLPDRRLDLGEKPWRALTSKETGASRLLPDHAKTEEGWGSFQEA